MPPTPTECKAIAAAVASLQAIDLALRTKLATETGAKAWATLIELGQNRQQLSEQQAALDICIRDHSAALQANLVVIDLATPAAPPPSRVAYLWEITATGATQRDSSGITSNSFSFPGPVPAQFSLSVATTGVADAVGPDFRSIPITAAGLAVPIRIEIVICPEMRLSATQLSQLVSTSFAPVHQHLEVPGGLVSADVSVLTADATVTNAGVVLKLTGQAVFSAGLGTFAFSGSTTLSLVPLAAPTTNDLVDILIVAEPVFEVLGALGPIATSFINALRGMLAPLFTDQLHTAIRTALPAVLTKSLVLTALPAGVTVSLRKVSIDAGGITFQSALGAIGTVISTFHPPAIPAP